MTQLELPFEVDNYSFVEGLPPGVRGVIFNALQHVSQRRMESWLYKAFDGRLEDLVHLKGSQEATNILVIMLDEEFKIGYPVNQFAFYGSTQTSMGVGKTKPGTPQFNKENYGAMKYD